LYQATELTERDIYRSIAKRIKDTHNRATLLEIADEEQKHYGIWESHTKTEVGPVKRRVVWYSLLARVFGFTFAIKRMESKFNDLDNIPPQIYTELMQEAPEAHGVFEDEARHELELIAMLEEERLQYVGSMVLGLNDALVEISGSLAGFAFAMQSNSLISLAGLITGISATLSMASSEFLSSRSKGGQNAIKSAFYTGIAYLITVALLILPYMVLPEKSYLAALLIMLGVVVLIIASFNYYIAVAKDLPFKKRFWEMTAISLGVAALSFGIGIVVKQVLGIDL
jgi:VIT1/CCC1 family predicted Fe2+/Mn2+ transporter